MHCAFAGFDNTCDLSAVLGILERASVFQSRIQTNAKKVRSEVRSEWGHCNFDHWTELAFQNSFQLMETMVRSLGLAKADEDKHLDKLQDWETKGTYKHNGKTIGRVSFISKIKVSDFLSFFFFFWGGGRGVITDMTGNIGGRLRLLICLRYIDLLYGNLKL